MLARDAGALRAAVLLVPHHGSKTSSTPEFIDAVAPQAGLLSVGYRNRFRHPNAAVVGRYVDRRIELHRTDAEGALHLELPGRLSGPLRIERVTVVPAATTRSTMRNFSASAAPTGLPLAHSSAALANPASAEPGRCAST